MIQLEDLDLHYNELQSLPASLVQLKNLKMLNLKGNKLGELDSLTKGSIPPCIFEILSLEDLSLNQNNLTQISPSISKLQNLKKLDLASNYNLLEIPTSILELKKLKHLDLSFNWEMGFIPKFIWEMTQLEVLCLIQTHLKDLPDDISKLINLKKLELYRNSINEEAQTKLKLLLPNTEIGFD